MVTVATVKQKLSREKTFENRWRIRIHRENFCGLLAPPIICVGMAADFAEKTFADGPKTSNLQRFSPSKFPAIQYILNRLETYSLYAFKRPLGP